MGDVVTMWWHHGQILANWHSQIKSRECESVTFCPYSGWNSCALFCEKYLLKIQILLYIVYILNLFVTGAWGSWRWGAEGEDYVFSGVKSLCFCSSNFELDFKNLFWKCLTFWSGFVANVEFMTFVLILIEVWIWGRDNVSFYANGHKDPKKQKHQ